MEDQFSDSSFEEANRLIHSAFNSTFAMHHAKNVAIRKQLLEAAIQKLLESKTFYISDVRDIAAMNNRVFDSRSKLYEQMNILNCREYRKMRAAVLELLPVMIHRATGIPEQRFHPIVEANRTAPERTAESVPATPQAAQSAPQSAAPVSAAPAATAAAVAPAAPSSPAVAEAVAAARSAEERVASAAPATPSHPVHAAAPARPLPLVLSLGLNLVLGTALLVSLVATQPDMPVAATTASGSTSVTHPPAVSAPAPAASNPAARHVAPVSLGTGTVSSAGGPYVVDSVIRTATPAASLAQVAAALPAEKAGNHQYVVGIRIEKLVN